VNRNQQTGLQKNGIASDFKGISVKTLLPGPFNMPMKQTLKPYFFAMILI